MGSGQGSGLGAGFGGGTGGGAYRPAGVESPRLVTQVRPNYTADAMRAKVQGQVLVEAVVMAGWNRGRGSVVRSLDNVFGLDQEAIKAAKQWKFMPGTRFGQPVPVLVTIELSFTLRRIDPLDYTLYPSTSAIVARHRCSRQPPKQSPRSLGPSPGCSVNPI